ncbi:hypothetical protein GCM10007857_46610 [Bradyrhizobium iriomotense]|uniref:Uncharacterized protein n=1 Tax=Bradyrhizobium iriomotense TaxID=441950 RepID=A0ABQ6B3C4_9BRAD|nr:hypothetical protein GCM10007857_46610 [Bradyrhizobium iriomotense]
MASPRAAAAANAIVGAASLESIVELPAAGAPATNTQMAASSVGARAEPTEAAASANQPSQYDDRVAPDKDSRDVARETIAPAPREWTAMEFPASSEAREIVHEVSSMKMDLIASDAPRSPAEAATASRGRPSRLAVVESAIAEKSGLEVLPRTQSRAAPDGPGEAAARMHLSRPGSVQASKEGVEASLSRAPDARSRDDRDGSARRPDRAIAAAPRGSAVRDRSVEVRIGVVTLEVHAPPQAAAPQAPARASFAPHRHYLRTW